MLRSIQSGLRRSVLLILVGLLGLTVVVLPAATAASRSPGLSTPHASTRTVDIAQDAAPQGLAVKAGLQIRNIYNLELSDQSFMAEGWYWLNWNDKVQAVLDKLKIQPEAIIEFTNEIEPSQYRAIEVLSQDANVGTGFTHSLYAKFSGKFYINTVAQRRAPFDRQHLEIAMEVKPIRLTQGADRIELMPIPTSQLPIAGEYTSVSGFNLTGTDWQRSQIHYIEPSSSQTQRDGEHGTISESASISESNAYSRITADFTYSPDPWTVFLKWLLPLIAVMGIVILSPSIDGALGDIRLAIPSAALLTLVVLHDGYKSNFPPTPYMTYLDKIYTYSYVVCLAIFVLFLVGTNAFSLSSDADRAAVSKQVNRLDLIVQVGTLVGFLIVATVGWFS